MKIRDKARLLTSLLTAAVLLLCSVTVFHGAEEKGCITLKYELSDAKFSLYQVGDITDSGVVCVDGFSGYHVDLNSENAAQTLESYIQRDNVAPLREVYTDSNGNAEISGLDKGVYLVTGEFGFSDGQYYFVMPSIISLPYNNEWDLTSYVKYAKGLSDIAQLTCVKVWKGAEGRKIYPDVHIQLLRNGELYDTVTLNKDNDYKYTWSYLESGYNWTVTEEELNADYSVDIERGEHVFTITNTVSDTVTETTVPSSPTEPATTTPKTTGTAQTASNTIPQTGQLNWPVPVLSVTGAALIIIGLIITRKKRNEP